MKSIITLFTVFILSTSLIGQVFVKHDANGNNDGTSWADAYNNLQNAIDSSETGSEIWVAAGVYYPPILNTPADSNFFNIHNSINLYGGFNGSESSLSQRDWVTNPTILSGDINNDDIDDDYETNKSDNTIHVVIISTDNVVMDGFELSYGKTRVDFVDPSKISTFIGGGLLNQHSAKIENCTFKQNFALGGGGIYTSEGGNIEVINCNFLNNYAMSNGGGLRIQNMNARISRCTFDGNSGGNSGGGGLDIRSLESIAREDSVVIEHCVFRSNQAEIGGGMLYTNFNQRSSLNLDSCSFTENMALNAGGAVYLQNAKTNASTMPELRPELRAKIGNTLFDSNLANVYGGAIINVNHSDTLQISISNCEFLSNQTLTDNAYTGGAGINNQGLAEDGLILYTIKNSSFIGNISSGISAAIWNTSNLPTESSPFIKGRISQSTFKDNFAKYCCGAFGAYGDDTVIEDCSFEENTTDGLHPTLTGGGAIGLILTKRTAIINSSFMNNGSNEQGSALNIVSAEKVNFENVLITDHAGGSTVFSDSPISFTNTTMVDNNFGLVIDSDPEIILQNTILNNSTNFVGAGSVDVISDGGNISSDNSLSDFLVENGTFPDFNETDPLLDENYIPQVGSPCVDAGNADGVTTAFDINGNERIQGNSIDIGAVESPYMTAVRDVIWDSNQFSVYPNPVVDHLKFEIKNQGPALTRIQLFDALGQLLLDKEDYDGRSVHMSNMASCNYIIIVTTQKEKYARKVVKK